MPRAVALNRILLIIFLFFIQACNANPDVYSEKAYELASNNFLQVKKEYENKIQECDNKKQVIDSPELQEINLTEKELYLTLAVLSIRADYLCVLKEAGKFSIASSIYRTTANHYKKKPSIASNYSEDLVFGHYWGNLELEAKYLEVEEKKRKRIENIEAFKQPFFPLKTASKLQKKLTSPSN